MAKTLLQIFEENNLIPERDIIRERINLKQNKMESKKQSSIEWLFFELSYTPKDKFEWHTILRKAKAMHKEEIIDAWSNAHTYDKKIALPSQYYKQTFEE